MGLTQYSIMPAWKKESKINNHAWKKAKLKNVWNKAKFLKKKNRTKVEEINENE